MSSRPRAEVRWSWIREQLRIAGEIIDNPGGGLVFGYQAMGQARAHLAEADEEAYAAVIGLLDQAEHEAVWRNYARSRELLEEALAKLPEA